MKTQASQEIMRGTPDFTEAELENDGSPLVHRTHQEHPQKK